MNLSRTCVHYFVKGYLLAHVILVVLTHDMLILIKCRWNDCFDNWTLMTLFYCYEELFMSLKEDELHKLLWYTDSGLEPSQVFSLRHKSQWLQGAPKLATLTAFPIVTLSQNASNPWWPSAVGGQPCFVIWVTSSFSETHHSFSSSFYILLLTVQSKYKNLPNHLSRSWFVIMIYCTVWCTLCH